MAKTQRNFAAGRMNKSIDERLLPNGEYIDGQNIRLGSTEDSEIGSVEITKGNAKLSTIKFPLATIGAVTPQELSVSAVCVGSYADEAADTIYWFVHDPNWGGIYPSGAGGTPRCDMIVSYNVLSQALNYHVISIWDGDSSLAQYQTTLNFSPLHLITGIDKVNDLLFFTDDYNPPRVINVKTNYVYPADLNAAVTATNPVDQISAEQLLVIKKPPLESPIISLSTASIDDNYLSDRFLCFAYRYKYENNEYSATSQFSDPAFLPGIYNLSSDTCLNDGMQNRYSQVSVEFNTGGPLVKEIEVVFKEAADSTIKIIETINKEEAGYNDNEVQQTIFDNSKIFTILSEGEILRLYDNVPKLAKAQTFMGNRLMYGNYVENYDLVTSDNQLTNLDYSTNLTSTPVGGVVVTTTVAPHTYLPAVTAGLPSTTVTAARLNLDFSNIDGPLKAGAQINISFDVNHDTFTNSAGGGSTPVTTLPPTLTPTTTISWNYTLPVDYDNAYQLAVSPAFVDSIGIGPAGAFGAGGTIRTVQECSQGTTLTDILNCVFADSLTQGNPTPLVKYTSGGDLPQGPTLAVSDQPTPSQGNGMTIVSDPTTPNEFSIILSPMMYVDDINTPTVLMGEFLNLDTTFAVYSLSDGVKSLHSNRGYEVGIVYMDEFNRSTTALTSKNNTVYVPCDLSSNLNKIQVVIPPSQIAPAWATAYKFAIKPTETTYETIYALQAYQDSKDLSWWFLLEGENTNKVEVGDKLIIKKDADGALFSCVFNAVLDKGGKEENFILALNPFYDPSSSPTDSANYSSEDNPPGSGGNPQYMQVPAGTYMQMKDLNFNAQTDVASAAFPTNYADIQQECSTEADYQSCTVSYKGLSGNPLNDGDPNDISSEYSPFNIPQGSRIRLKIKVRRKGNQWVSSVCPEREYLYDKTWTADNSYEDIIAWWDGMSIAESLQDATFIGGTSVAYITPVGNSTTSDSEGVIIGGPVSSIFGGVNIQWNRNPDTNKILFNVKSFAGCGPGTGLTNDNDAVITKVLWEIDFGSSGVVFETEPTDALPNIWYEGDATYPIDKTAGNVGGHLGSYDINPQNAALGKRYPTNQDQNLATAQAAIINTTFFNCYSFGNGVESYKIEDSLVGKAITLGNRSLSTLTDEFKEADRFADITYSGVFQDETNINRLNEFNLGLANFKTLEDTYGAVEILSGRKTDVLVLQEDKISYVLAGKNLLSDSGGGGQLTSVPEVLGKQIARVENYGISNNPESFAVYGKDKFFIDAKRGAVLQLKGDTANSESLRVISESGMRSWFRDTFNGTLAGYGALGGNTQRLGGFDPYMNEYVIGLNDNPIFYPLPVYLCGTDISFSTTTTAPLVFNIDLGTDIGAVTWTLTNTAELTYQVEWNGGIVVGPTLAAPGTHTLTFNKTAASPQEAKVTITPTAAVENEIVLLPNCPTPIPLTVVQVVVGSATTGDVNYNYSMYEHGTSGYVPPSRNYAEWYGTGVPTSPQQQALPLVRWDSNTYNVGENGAPIDGQTVYMYTSGTLFPQQSNTSLDPYQFKFNPNLNKFKYWRTNTAYTPTATDVATILANATNASTPYQKWDTTGSPIGWNNVVGGDLQQAQYRGNFVMPAPVGTQEYLYLVWDLRDITEDVLCYSNVSLFEACCECTCGVGVCTKYRITNNNVGYAITYTYTNCSGVVSTIEVFPATSSTPYVDICANTYPTTTVTDESILNNITITVEGCGLPCP